MPFTIGSIPRPGRQKHQGVPASAGRSPFVRMVRMATDRLLGIDVERLIEDHMDDLVQNRLPKIVQETGLDMESVQEAMNLMHKLDLAPGKRLVSEEVKPILPDVIVEYDERGMSMSRPSATVSFRRCEYPPDTRRCRRIAKSTRRLVNSSARALGMLAGSSNRSISARVRFFAS